MALWNTAFLPAGKLYVFLPGFVAVCHANIVRLFMDKVVEPQKAAKFPSPAPPPSTQSAVQLGTRGACREGRGRGKGGHKCGEAFYPR